MSEHKDKVIPEGGSEPQATPFPENAEPDKAKPDSTDQNDGPEENLHPGLVASLAAFQAHVESEDSGTEQAERVSPGASSEPSPEPQSPSSEDPGDYGDSSAGDGENSVDEGESSVAAIAEDALPAQSNDEEENTDEQEREDRPMTLRDHLVELRRRLTRAFACAVLGFCVCYPFAEQIFQFLLTPLQRAMPPDSKFIFTSPPEAFFTYLKAAFIAGIFISCPLIFYQIWAFIAPGLYKEEKIYIVPVAFFSALFFISGGAFCFFIAFPFIFEFFMSYYTANILPMPKMDESFSFVLQLILAFGVVFELPLFTFFLARLGLVTAAWLRKVRRYAVLVNVIVAAILTPPDVMSQMLMAGPLLLLYEISIIIAAIFGKKKPQPAPEGDEDDEEDTEEEGEARIKA